MICRYFADDGTEFDNEEECLEYEKEQELNSLESPYMWDENGNPTDDVARAYYVKTTKEAQSKAFYLMSKDIELSYPNDLYKCNEKEEKSFNIGSWGYDDICDSWFKVGDEIKKLKSQIKILEKYL